MKIGQVITKEKTDRKTICKDTGVHVNTVKKIEETHDGVLSKILSIFKSFGFDKAEIILYRKGGKTKIDL